MMEEIEWYVKAKLDPEGHTDRVLIKQRGEYRVFVRERTCHWIGLEEWKNPVECSECGVLVVAHVALDSNYCPNCGARVVSEEEQGHMVADAIRRLEKAVEK